MSDKYQVRLEPGIRLEQRATRFARSGTIALALMAALPAALGLLQHATFVASTRVLEIGSQNAAATAPALGNQPSHSALENGGKGMLARRETCWRFVPEFPEQSRLCISPVQL